jgi:hypothetical protein
MSFITNERTVIHLKRRRQTMKYRANFTSKQQHVSTMFFFRVRYRVTL